MVFKFFENITKVTLPHFIDKLINGNLPNNFKFNYFTENPEEVVFHRSICFSIDDIYVFLSNISNCKDKLFNNEKTLLEKIFNHLNYLNCKEIIDSLRNIEEYETKANESKRKEKKEKKILNYFLFTKLLVNDKYKKIFTLNQERPNFNIKEWERNKYNDQRIIIIRVKNIISALLFNYRSLIKRDFDEGTTQNTIKILKELKKMKKKSNFVIDGAFPPECYANSLIDMLNYLPNDLQLNDFENLFKSLENDVINSIKEIDFEAMSIYLQKVKLSKKELIFYENAKKSIIDLELNEKVQSIIEKESIPSIISLRYTKKKKEFKIEKGKISIVVPKIEIFKNDNEKKKICPTIESFVYKFPDFSKIQQQLEDVDLFKLEEELNYINEIFNYFKLIKEFLNKNLNIDENSHEFKYINNKINDYVMENIYDKIYPKNPYEEDNKIYRNCILLSWVESKHFIRNNNYIYDNFLTDITSYFDKIESEKSPRKKLLNLSQIFDSFENAFQFHYDNIMGVDDQIPILNYELIKAHPHNICTNYRFMNFFLGLEKSVNTGCQLSLLEAACNCVNNIRYDYLYDVTEEIFNKNCSIFNNI